MTTIAFRDGVLAADRQATMNAMKFPDGKKIAKIGGLMVAAAGRSDDYLLFLDWLRAGLPEEKRPELSDSFCALTYGDGRLLLWSEKLRPEVIRLPFFAIGLGQAFAMGAMAAGTTAVKAVELSCQWSDGAAFGVESLP